MRIMQLSHDDNVAVAMEPLAPEVGLPGDITVRANIPMMHKVATRPITNGELVVKYGQIIGRASCDIEPGDYVHVHNCEMVELDRTAQANSATRETVFIPESDHATFEGYRRGDGQVGTRNYIGILTSVNCSATAAKQIETAVEKSGIIDRYDNVDGVVALTHSSGCGMQSKGDGFAQLQRVINGYIAQPNFGGLLVVGLGCEVMQLSRIGRDTTDTVHKLVIQDSGGTRSTVERGVAIVKDMLETANQARRETVSASELTVGLECGGSDAYSGITANPALGAAVDILVSHSGTAILSETPEIYGAEHLLIQRAVSENVADVLRGRIEWWRNYAKMHGDTLDANPSPGNHAGGLTTILEKSLGAQVKGGSTNLEDVILYAERVKTKGLNFMDSPGFDAASVTGQVAAGANLICFTTGRGSGFGCKPVPSIKLATNTPLYKRMPDDMDIDCGGIVDGRDSVEECGRRIFDKFLAVASGQPSCSEALDYGDYEFVPWQTWATY